MKVMHVIEAMDRGGAESLVVEHVRHAGPGVSSVVCALNRGGAMLEAAQAAGARTVLLGKGAAGVRGLAAVGRLAALMRDERPEVVNGHNPTGGLYAALAARLAGVRAVVRTEHSLHYPGRHSRLYPLLEPAATALTGRVICVCEAVRASHSPRMPWAAGRFVTVLNGIADAAPGRPRSATRAALGWGEGERVALAVGSLTPQKAHALLLEAFGAAAARIPGARLVIAGEGRLRDALARQVEEGGLGARVSMLGARDDVADLMGAADLFVLSSRREGLSITLLEAMRAGRAAVATRAGGSGEAVEDGVTGRLVPAGDAAALANAMGELLADDARAEAMGRAGRRRWQERFAARRMVRETEAVYLELLAGAGTSEPGGERR